MTAVAADVRVCLCGHGPRLHNDDYGCKHHDCDCSGYRNIDATPAPQEIKTAADVSASERVPIEAPLRCTKCPREFATLKALLAHKPTHEPPVVCTFCSRAFSRPAGLTRHLRESHPETGADADPTSPGPDQPHQDGQGEVTAAFAPEQVSPLEPVLAAEPHTVEEVGSAATPTASLNDDEQLRVDTRDVLITLGKEAQQLRDQAVANTGTTIRTLTARIVFGGDHTSFLEVNLANVGREEFAAFAEMILGQLVEPGAG